MSKPHSAGGGAIAVDGNGIYIGCRVWVDDLDFGLTATEGEPPVGGGAVDWRLELQKRGVNTATIGMQGFIGEQTNEFFFGLTSALDSILGHPDCAKMLGFSPTDVAGILGMISNTSFISANKTGQNGRPSGQPENAQGTNPANHPISLYNNFWLLEPSAMATVLIHEFWHFRGGGLVIGNNQPDADRANDDPIVRQNCGTGLVRYTRQQ